MTCWVSILITFLPVTMSLLNGNDWCKSNSLFLVYYSKGSSVICKRSIVLIVGCVSSGTLLLSTSFAYQLETKGQEFVGLGDVT